MRIPGNTITQNSLKVSYAVETFQFTTVVRILDIFAQV